MSQDGRPRDAHLRYACLRHRRKGAAIAEAAAALTLLLPVVFLVLYAVVEASYAYLIKSSLDEAARTAARDLSIDYGQNPSIATDRNLQNALVYDSIRIHNIVNDSSQFDSGNFNTVANPPTVSVTVHYLGGQYGLPPFPNPDPLNLGSSFQINASSTYRLE